MLFDLVKLTINQSRQNCRTLIPKDLHRHFLLLEKYMTRWYNHKLCRKQLPKCPETAGKGIETAKAGYKNGLTVVMEKNYVIQ